MATTALDTAERVWLKMKEVDWDLLSSYAGLLGLATASIYAGAFGSLPRKQKSVAKSKNSEPKEEEEEDEEDIGRMSSNEAWLFPVMGSVALLGLYMIVEYLGDVWINRLLGWYFAAAGVGSVWNSSVSLTRYLVGETQWKKFDHWQVSVKKGSREIVQLSSRTPSLVLLPLALIPSGLYVFWKSGRRSVLLTDVLALSFSHNALSLLKLDSFKTGAILLCGLFVYDVWWVFGSEVVFGAEVMVKVATRIDAPIKLLWPKSVVFGGGRGYTMLGLGDVVVPGTFVALALRHDWERGLQGRPYFYGSLVGYVTGLAVTMGVMHVYGTAQPALLYVSPACLAGFGVAGAVRGELWAAWSS